MSTEAFDIPITWKDAELSFLARVIPAGYITRIGVTINGRELLLEPDEEGQYRLLMEPDVLGNYPDIDLPLVREIAHVLNTVVGSD